MKNRFDFFSLKSGKTKTESKQTELSFAQLIAGIQNEQTLQLFLRNLFDFQQGISSVKMLGKLQEFKRRNVTDLEIERWTQFFNTHEIAFLPQTNSNYKDLIANFKLINKETREAEIITINYLCEKGVYRKVAECISPVKFERFLTDEADQGTTALITVSEAAVPLLLEEKQAFITERTIHGNDLSIIKQIITIFKILEEREVLLEDKHLTNWTIVCNKVQLTAHSNLRSIVAAVKQAELEQNRLLLACILYEYFTGVSVISRSEIVKGGIFCTEYGDQYWSLIEGIRDHTLSQADMDGRLAELEKRHDPAYKDLFVRLDRVNAPVNREILRLLMTERVQDLPRHLASLTEACDLAIKSQTLKSIKLDLGITVQPLPINPANLQNISLMDLKLLLEKRQNDLELQIGMVKGLCNELRDTIKKLQRLAIGDQDTNMNIFLEDLKKGMQVEIGKMENLPKKMQVIRDAIKILNRAILGLSKSENQELMHLFDKGENGYEVYAMKYEGKIHNFMKPNGANEKVAAVRTALLALSIPERMHLKKTLIRPRGEILAASLNHESFDRFKQQYTEKRLCCLAPCAGVFTEI